MALATTATTKAAAPPEAERDRSTCEICGASCVVMITVVDSVGERVVCRRCWVELQPDPPAAEVA